MDLLSQPLTLFLRAGAVWIVWCLLPDRHQEFFARRLVLGVGLWHLSAPKKRSPTAALVPARPRPDSNTRQVSFGQLEILEFPTLLGDNPSVKRGAPVTMDWKPIRKSIQRVDGIPDRRGPHRPPHVLTPLEREVLLLSKGYTLLEIENAAPKRRSSTHQQHREAPFHFVNLKAKLQKLVHRRSC